MSRDLLERVSRKTGVDPDRVNVLRDLGSLVVSAKPQFLKELIDQPEIEAAVANRRSEPVVDLPPGRDDAA